MTEMRDRLMKLLTSDLPHFTNDIAFWHTEHIGELADYLIANGVILPPCKVGDTVYIVRPCEKTIIPMRVVQIEIDQVNLWVRADDGIMHCVRPYADYCYSKKEAEAKLKEYEGK